MALKTVSKIFSWKNSFVRDIFQIGKEHLWFWPFVLLFEGLFLAINYLVLLQTTTWTVFWNSNVSIYNILQILLTVLLGLVVGVGLGLVLVSLERKRKETDEGITHLLLSSVFGVSATGCTVCGAFLLPYFGIAASLAALPLGGLEIKGGALILATLSVRDITRKLTGCCELSPPVMKVAKGYVEFDLSWRAIKGLWLWGLAVFFFVGVYSLRYLPPEWRVSFRREQVLASSASLGSVGNASNTSFASILEEINPREGFELNVSYGDLGPKMLELGVIDLEKFKQVYERAGQPLTPEQLEILTKGSNKKIKITRENAYFLLNFFWAVGLANNNEILTKGPITKYGEGQLGYFASTGGWILGKDRNALTYYAKGNLIALTPEQQRRVWNVANNVYRPCCGNPTSFPDCNHGMAMLGVLELLAANGATEEEMFEAAKWFNAFWFPQSYADLAMYFRITEGKSFKEIDPKVLLSKDYSSVFGWTKARKVVQRAVGNYQPNLGGTGCGV